MKNQAGITVFGLRLKRLRKERKLSQQYLADIAEVGKKTIQRIEMGQASAGLDVLISLAQALKVPLHELVRVEE